MELIIFSIILIVSVIAHFFLWRDSKRRYTEYMKQADALNEKLKQLEANDREIDGMLDYAEADLEHLEDEINALRLGRFLEKGKADFVN